MSEVDPNQSLERAATIDLAAIRHNISRVSTLVGPKTQVMAVVKADAYGHGAVPVAEAAVQAGATWLGAVHVSEGLALRNAGLSVPILSWLHTPGTDFEAGISAHIDLGVSGWELEPIAAAAETVGTAARVHLKIDTGLGRNGCPAELWPDLLNRAARLEQQGLIKVVGVFSHFAVADEPDRPETEDQLVAFRAAVGAAADAGFKLEVRHIANTPALLSRPDTHFDLVRCGLATYGLSPFEDRGPKDFGLRPAMRLTARVANAKRVPAGQGVSYGLRWHSEGPTTLGLIPLGYADGIPRVAESGPVRIKGVTYRSVGRIAMDQFVVDLGPGADPSDFIGEEAVLFGGEEDPSAAEWANAAGSINYEIVTRIAPRVPRAYINAK